MDSQLYLDDLDIENDSTTTLENEKRPSSLSISHKSNASWFQITWITILSLSNILLIFLLLSYALSHKLDNNRTKQDLYFASNYTPNPDLVSLNHQNDYLWEEIVPSGISVLSTQGISHWEKGDFSMFHQLHCIRSMRTVLQDYITGKDPGVDWHDDAHWPHCLDYMVQSFLCHADDTVERENIINGFKTPNISGYQEIRQCKATEELYDLKAQGIRDWVLKRKDWALVHCDSSGGTPPDNTCNASDLKLVEASKNA